MDLCYGWSIVLLPAQNAKPVLSLSMQFEIAQPGVWRCDRVAPTLSAPSRLQFRETSLQRPVDTEQATD